jgi:FtsP/CotA-like multicopper oxidase with cupredoxin domain
MEGPMTGTSDHFPTAIAGLPLAQPPAERSLRHGDQFDLRIAPVKRQLGESVVRLLAYNASIPGPTIRVQQGSELLVHVHNEGDLETTVHWHGLRLDNRFDGTPDTQPPIPVRGQFTYRLAFPDPGAYWYHPHIREDYGQEMGLYGAIIVEPMDAEYWPPAHREVALMLDDILIQRGAVAPFSRTEVTHTAMGRFGNMLLVNGEPEAALTARRGEVVRFYITNTANTRVFNVGLPGARMKLVGGDSGRCEREELVDHVVVAPSERAVVDVFFTEAGEAHLEHRTPRRTYRLATVSIDATPVEPSLASEFETLRVNAELAAERERIAPVLAAEPDKTLALVAEMDMGEPELPAGATITYVCPMHPEVTSNEPGRCPKCGMKLLAAAAPAASYACPMHPDVTSDKPDRCPKCGMKLVPAHLVPDATSTSHHAHGHASAGEHEDRHGNGEDSHDAGGIEWEDDMVEVNRMTTPANMRWKLIDRASGAAGAAIKWRFRVGERIKIRLVNEMDSDHPMHHPFHMHGAGRFLVLTRNGVRERNLVWKDTVLIRTGETIDILLDVTNPGLWMAHCHIAEHHESGMMFRFRVDP